MRTKQLPKVSYPFPLDDGEFIYLWAPLRCLTEAEANRLCEYVKSLSIKEDS